MPFFQPFSAEAAYQQEGSNEVDSEEKKQVWETENLDRLYLLFSTYSSFSN